MNLVHKSFVFPLLLAAGLAVEGAQADALAVDVNAFDSAGTPFNPQTQGYAFTVDAGVQYTVTALGVFDNNFSGPGGLIGAHEVGIWNSDGSTLLAKATVPSGASGTVVESGATTQGGLSVGQWRFVDLGTSVVLGPGSYLIGALNPGGGANGDTYLDVNNANLGSLSTLSGITVTEGRINTSSTFAAPTQSLGVGYFGPSFLVEPAIVNPDLTVAVSGQSTNTTPVSEGPAGVFSFTATYCGKTASPTLEALVSRTRVLTNGNSLVNRNRDGSPDPGGVDSELDFPLGQDYADGQLDPNECVDVTYEIGLAQLARFNFSVDVLGIEGTSSPATCSVCSGLDCLLGGGPPPVLCATGQDVCTTRVLEKAGGNRDIERDCGVRATALANASSNVAACETVEDVIIPDNTDCWFVCDGVTDPDCNEPPDLIPDNGRLTP